MKRIAYIILLLFIVRSSSIVAASLLTDSLLAVYDRELLQSQMYYDQREQRIQAIKQVVYPDAYDLLLAIGDAYRPYQCDSAIAYYDRVQNAPQPYATMAKIRLINVLASSGGYIDAYAIIDSLGEVPVSQKKDYYRALNRLMGESAVYGKYPKRRNYRFAQAWNYQDSLYHLLLEEAPSCERYEIQQKRLRDHDHQYEKALLVNDSAMAITDPSEHEYAILTYERAITYRAMGEQELFLQWLIRSAIADVRCGVTDNGSSWMVAEQMFNDGDYARAYRYISYSIANAGFFNASLRYMQITPIANIITQSYQEQEQEWSRTFRIVDIVLFVLLLMLVPSLVYVIRQYHRVHRLNEKQVHLNNELSALNTQLVTLNTQLSTLNSQLTEASLVKEQYICRYLEVYSEYIQRLTHMARKAGVKDADALQNKEMAEFYRSFDSAFLSIYRTFVVDFNTLLKPEEQIVPKQGELLTTELRIFALIRLGIDSSNKIAQLLCYSPNTIYNYRARVKNAAIGDRDQFEAQVRQLCTIK